MYPMGMSEKYNIFVTSRTSSARHARRESSGRGLRHQRKRDKPKRTEPASQGASPRSSHTRNTGDVTPPDFDPRIHCTMAATTVKQSPGPATLHIWPKSQWSDRLSLDPASVAALLYLQLSIPGQYAVEHTHNFDLSPSGRSVFSRIVVHVC